MASRRVWPTLQEQKNIRSLNASLFALSNPRTCFKTTAYSLMPYRISKLSGRKVFAKIFMVSRSYCMRRQEQNTKAKSSAGSQCGRFTQRYRSCAFTSKDLTNLFLVLSVRVRALAICAICFSRLMGSSLYRGLMARFTTDGHCPHSHVSVQRRFKGCFLLCIDSTGLWERQR